MTIKQVESLKYSCDGCDKVFHYKLGIELHVQIHNKYQDNFRCEYCNRFFNRYKNMHVHVAKVHGKSGKKKYILTKIPITKTQRPINKVLPNKSNMCKICKKDFEFPSSLLKHSLYHENSRRYECNLCDLRFINTTGLSNHKIKVHDKK